MHRMFLFGLRHAKYVFGGLFLLCTYALYVFTVQADVALFFSDTYVEQGTELSDETGEINRIQYEHTWTDFKGVVPEGVDVNSIFLHLTWSKVVRTGEEQMSTSTEEVLLDESLVAVPDTENHSTSTSEVEVEHTNSVGTIASPEPVVSESVVESIVTPVSEVGDPVASPSPTIPSEALEPEAEVKSEEEEQESAPSSEDQATPSDTTGFEEVAMLKLFTFAFAEFEDPIR